MNLLISDAKNREMIFNSHFPSEDLLFRKNHPEAIALKETDKRSTNLNSDKLNK